jgi:hypothetical protein
MSKEFKQVFKHSEKFGPITERDQELVTEFLTWTDYTTTHYVSDTYLSMFKDWAEMQD